MTISRLVSVGAALLVAGVPAGCASTGSTWGSGVGDSYFEGPPYAAGARPLEGAAVAVLPVSYQRGATLPANFDVRTGDGSAVAGLLAEMNAYLAARGQTPLAAAAPQGTAPDVQFGCERQPDDECASADSRRPHRLAVARPSTNWVSWADSVAAAAGADYLLVITLEAGNYFPRQRNLRGSKEVLLGTGHGQDLPWLTALDRPVSVLQLTGALVARDGRARRIAAEGLVARSTNIVLAGLGAQALITDKDVDAIVAARRNDLPGAPPAWQAALDALLASLVGDELRGPPARSAGTARP